MLKFSLSRQALVLSLFLSLARCRGSGRHHSGPHEDNVFSPPICSTNQDGFGGAIGTNIFTVTYTYEMEMSGQRQDPVNDLIFSLERSIADFFLQTTPFNNVPCDRRKLEDIPDEITSRRLVPVGISINPEDIPNSSPCENIPAGGNDCIGVDGSFQVYTVGNSPNDDSLPEDLKAELKTAMDNGEFDEAHSEIVRVFYVEPTAAADSIDELNDPDPSPVRSTGTPNPNSSVIIGASAGALLVVAALVFYRRRNSKDDEADVTTQGGSNLV